MKKTNRSTGSRATEEIIFLERIAGGDPGKALRNRRIRHAIKTIRHAWAEESGRAQSDLHDLLSGSPEWRWPIKIYTHEELRLREERLKAELSKNRNLKLSPYPGLTLHHTIQGGPLHHDSAGKFIKKIIKILKKVKVYGK